MSKAFRVSRWNRNAYGAPEVVWSKTGRIRRNTVGERANSHMAIDHDARRGVGFSATKMLRKRNP